MYIGTLGVRVRESQNENKTERKGEYQEEFFFPAKVLREVERTKAGEEKTFHPISSM